MDAKTTTSTPKTRQFRAQKKSKLLIISGLDFLSVGITGLEPATSRPPDVCATNCAKSRSVLLSTELVTFVECGCKGTTIFRILQIFSTFFAEKFYNNCYFLGHSSNISYLCELYKIKVYEV